MRKRAIIFLYLLPLVILISLPCSIKQDIKQLLGIPVQVSLQIEKSSNTVCVYSSTQKQKKDSKKKEQQRNLKTVLFRSPLSRPFVPTEIALYESTGSDPSYFSSIPIFLVYRKLII